MNNLNKEHCIDLSDCNFLFLFGPPGSGKNRVTKLIQKLGIDLDHISIGDLLREAAEQDNERARFIRDYQKIGETVPLPIVVSELSKRITICDKRLIVLDGFPRTLEQAMYLTESGYVSLDTSRIFGIHIPKDLETCWNNIESANSKKEEDDSNFSRGSRTDDNYKTVKHRHSKHFTEAVPALNQMVRFGMPLYDTGSATDTDPLIPDIIRYFGLKRFQKNECATNS